MAETAFQTLYRTEFIAGLEERESFLRKTVVTEGEVKGNQFVFLVADSGGASATTRGANGLIPARADSQTQTTATLVEWHDLVRKTSFTVDLSQGNQRKMMQQTSMGVINRKIDEDLIDVLDTATNNTGAAATMSVALVMKALTILGNNYVNIGDENNMWGVITNSAWAYLMQTSEFSNGDYVDTKMYDGSIKRTWRWAGINWIRHNLLTGTGTASEKCYIYHRDAIGSAMDKQRVASVPGYNDEQDYHYVRTSGFFGSALLQDNAVVQIVHDGSAYVAG